MSACKIGVCLIIPIELNVVPNLDVINSIYSGMINSVDIDEVYESLSDLCWGEELPHLSFTFHTLRKVFTEYMDMLLQYKCDEVWLIWVTVGGVELWFRSNQ
jgi:hypothetical protein